MKCKILKAESTTTKDTRPITMLRNPPPEGAMYDFSHTETYRCAEIRRGLSYYSDPKDLESQKFAPEIDDFRRRFMEVSAEMQYRKDIQKSRVTLTGINRYFIEETIFDDLESYFTGKLKNEIAMLKGDIRHINNLGLWGRLKFLFTRNTNG